MKRVRTRLLSVNADAKTRKGTGYGVLTGILYLSPANISGHEMCPHRSPGCTAACLYTAGRGATRPVHQARLRKTDLFFSDRSVFWIRLIDDIRLLVRAAQEEGLRPAVRLNGTSDQLWERIPVVIGGEFRAQNIMELFPDIQFYDYTKVPIKYRGRPDNYHLTFSLSENNDASAMAALMSGVSVAVVFRDAIPRTWSGFHVHSGEAQDARFLDPPGCIVGLTAKGRAKNDDTGFVRESESVFRNDPSVIESLLYT